MDGRRWSMGIFIIMKFDKGGGLCYYFSIICSFQFNREINALYESMILLIGKHG